MIQKKLFLLSTILVLIGCGENSSKISIYVNDVKELKDAIAKATPGDEIVMANGDWTDVQIRFVGYGN